MSLFSVNLLKCSKECSFEWSHCKTLKREKQYLNGSLEVHVSSLVRSLRVWIEVHFKVNAICIFCRKWNQLQLPCHLIILSDLLLSLKVKPKSGKQVCFQLLITHDQNHCYLRQGGYLIEEKNSSMPNQPKVKTFIDNFNILLSVRYLFSPCF